MKETYDFWLTPPELLKSLDKEFHFDFDPCPWPRPPEYNSLVLPWGKVNYVNPPFRRSDGPYGGPTAFVRKAIEEQEKGKTSVLLLPVHGFIDLLARANAEIRSAGRVKWIDGRTGKKWPSPGHSCVFVLKGKE